MIYESADYHNVVFVGFDADGVPRHAHKRGTGSQSSYKGNIGGSLPEYSFHWHGQSERLYLFEAPIDLLSFISMNKDKWQQHSYAACCGVADHVLWQMMKDNPHIEKVYLCLDNDKPGQQAADRSIGKLVVADIGIRLIRDDYFLAKPEEAVFPHSDLSLDGDHVTLLTPGEAEDLSKAGQTIPDVAQELALRSRRLVRVLGRYALATDGYRTYFLEGGEYPQVIQVG